jgi:hypothetical protein
LVIGAVVATMVAAVPVWRHAGDWVGSHPPLVCQDVSRNVGPVNSTYATSFPLAEIVISEGGRWHSGKAVGLDWSDVRTTPGLAFGLESGSDEGAAAFNDSTALLSGRWVPDQAAEASVHSVEQDDNRYEEVELRLRSTVAPHCTSGYEVNFRCSKTAKAYAEIVRWNGRLGEFTYLNRGTGSQFGVAEGDVVKATIVGDVITAYINGREVLQARDHTYSTGSPGMGFYLRGKKPTEGECGFSRFAASASRE